MTTSQDQHAEPGSPALDADEPVEDPRVPYLLSLLLLAAACLGLAVFAMVKSHSGAGGADATFRGWVYHPLEVGGWVTLGISVAGILPLCFLELPDLALRLLVAAVLVIVLPVLVVGASIYASHRDVGKHLLTVAGQLALPAGVTRAVAPTLDTGQLPVGALVTLQAPSVVDTWHVAAGASTPCQVVKAYAAAHRGAAYQATGCAAVIRDGLARIQLSVPASPPSTIAVRLVPND